MDAVSIGTLIGVGATTVGTFLQAYASFKKSNVEDYFQQLIESKEDLTKIGTDDQLTKIVFNIVDEVAKETSTEKITNWKNLTIKFATQFDRYDTAEKYSNILSDLTAFDLLVLSVIYESKFSDKRIFIRHIIEQFSGKNVKDFDIVYSVKVLSRNYLLSEQSSDYPNKYDTGWELYYELNQFGREFIKMIK